MASEFKRGVIRVLSNYARLFVMLVLGILFVPIFIMGVGDDAFGLIGLLGSTIGIAEMCQAIARDSMNRELGAAYHNDDPEEFSRTYNSAIVLTTALAVITAGFFTILYFLLPFLNISQDLMPAAKWLLILEGGKSILMVLTAPAYNMYMVLERMVLVNVWKIASRSVDLIAAIILFVFFGMRDPASGLIAFAVCSAGGRTLITAVSLCIVITFDHRLIPRISYVQHNAIARVLSTAGWNTFAVIATNMHIRLNNVIMNVAFGLLHNAAFTLAVRLTAYVRVLAFANTFGLDVVSARISTREGYARIVEIMHHTTRVHALVALPAGMIVFLLASPLLTVWVGRTVENPETITMAATLAKIMVIGMTAHGISECWTRMLYGAGFVRAYAPLVLFGGLLNPMIAITLIFILPASISYTGPAISFTAIFIFVHFMIIPFITARCLKVRVWSIVSPILRPVLTTAMSSPLLLIPRIAGQPDSLILILLALMLFGAAVAPLGWFFVLDASDRDRISGAIKRRLDPEKRRKRQYEAEEFDAVQEAELVDPPTR